MTKGITTSELEDRNDGGPERGLPRAAATSAPLQLAPRLDWRPSPGRFELLAVGRATWHRMEHMAMGARREVVGCVTADPRRKNLPAISRRLAERGVHVRTLIPQVADVQDTGGEIRTAEQLQLDLQVVDRSVAALPTDSGPCPAGLLVIGEPTLVAALRALFEVSWRRASPPRENAAAAVRESPDEQGMAVLSLLSRGMTDAAIARRLGISLRTERRILTSLMEVLDASSRFQLALEAVRHGYL